MKLWLEITDGGPVTVVYMSQSGLATRRWAGEQKGLSLVSLWLSFLFKKRLWFVDTVLYLSSHFGGDSVVIGINFYI